MKSITKIAATIATAVVLGTGMVATTTPAAQANPGSPGCWTKAEWLRVHNGMTRAQVFRITGTNGTVDDYYQDADGSIDKYVSYHECYGNGRRSPYTTFLRFSNYRYDSDYNLVFTQFTSQYKGSWFRP